MNDENKKEVEEALKNVNESDILNSEEMDAAEGGFLNRCTYNQNNHVSGCGFSQNTKPADTL